MSEVVDVVRCISLASGGPKRRNASDNAAAYQTDASVDRSLEVESARYSGRFPSSASLAALLRSG